MKPKRPNIIEKLQAKAPKVQLQDGDVINLLFAARAGLRNLSGGDLVNCSASIANVEAAFTAAAPKQEKPPTDAKPDAKG